MNINTRDIAFTNFNEEEMQWVKVDGVIIYEAWKKLTANGVPPLTLLNCKGVDLVDYKLYGNSVQEEKFYPKLETLGFLPASGEYPTTNTTYPNATYEIIPIKAGQRYDFNYLGSNMGKLRVRCIYNKKLIGDVGLNNLSGENDYLETTMYYGQSSPKNGYIIAKKDLELGIVYIVEKPSDFKLEITSTIPTPEAPIEIESVGDKTNNLFNENLLISDFYDVQESGITLKSPDNSAWATLSPLMSLPAGTYSVSFTENTARFQIYDENDNAIIVEQSSKGIFTLIEPKSLKIKVLSKTTYPMFVGHMQIEKNSTYTTYEPYGYKIPVITRSKNILPFPYYEGTKTQADVTWNVNNDRSVTISGTPTGYSIFYMAFYMEIESDTDYTFNLGLSEDADNLTLPSS